MKDKPASLLRPDEAIKLLDVTRSTFYAYLQDGYLHKLLFRRKIVVQRAEVEAMRRGDIPRPAYGRPPGTNGKRMSRKSGNSA